MSHLLRVAAKFVVCLAIISCDQLECDQKKQESVVVMNKAIETAQVDPEKAVKMLEQALTADPGNHRAAYNMGLLIMKGTKSVCIGGEPSGKTEEERRKSVEERKARCKGAWEKTADAFGRAVQINPEDAMYQYNLGHALFASDKLDLGSAALEKATKLNPRLYKGHWYLGLIHRAQDHPKEAALAWSEACRLNPEFGKPYRDLADLYYQWDYFNEAALVLEEGARYAKAAEEHDRTDIYYLLGLVRDALGHLPQAAAAYENALKEKADNLDAKFQLGFTYANLHEGGKARKYFKEYLDAASSMPSQQAKVMAANVRLLQVLASK